MYRNSDPVGSLSGLTSRKGLWNGGWLVFNAVVVVVKSFVDGHNFGDGRLL